MQMDEEEYIRPDMMLLLNVMIKALKNERKIYC
jgi:hypothetical protein